MYGPSVPREKRCVWAASSKSHSLGLTWPVSGPYTARTTAHATCAAFIHTITGIGRILKKTRRAMSRTLILENDQI